MGWSWGWTLLLGGSLSTPSVDPLPIVGGLDAGTCEFPSAVALVTDDTVYCTATLIHPQVVLTAAHCLLSVWGTPEAIAFGEDGLAPEFTTGVIGCGSHPMYDPEAELHSPEDAFDLGYCILDAPVDVTPTPLIMGCEVEQLEPGRDVVIVGFGASSYPEDAPLGVGLKRYTTQTLEAIDDLEQVFLVGEQTSACSGDSGGPAYVQLADGSWRVIGAGSRVHPDSPPNPPFCTYGVVYGGAWAEAAWFEEETTLDLTPCFDAQGNVDMGPGCGAAPLDMQAIATWDDACAAQPVGDATEVCGRGGSGATDTGDGSGDGTSDDAGLDESGGTVGSDGEGGGTDGPLGTGDTDAGSAGATAEETGGTGDTGGATADDRAPSGCGCDVGDDDLPAPSRWGPWVAVVLALGRRRRSG